MDGDNMPMAFKNGHVYSREVWIFVIIYTLPMKTDLHFFISGVRRDGSKEWWHCDLSTDGGIVSIHRAAKGVYLMKPQAATASTSSWCI
jgi:hypothetical protein